MQRCIERAVRRSCTGCIARNGVPGEAERDARVERDTSAGARAYIFMVRIRITIRISINESERVQEGAGREETRDTRISSLRQRPALESWKSGQTRAANFTVLHDDQRDARALSMHFCVRRTSRFDASGQSLFLHVFNYIKKRLNILKKLHRKQEYFFF